MLLFGKKSRKPKSPRFQSEDLYKDNNRRAVLFRRGQTIHQSQYKLASSERHDLRRLSQRRLGIFRLLLASGLMMFLVIMIIASTIHHQQVVVTDFITATPVDQELYQTILRDYFRERPLERWRSAFNIDDLNAIFRVRSPEISRVQRVETRFLKSSLIYLSLRRPVAMWESAGKKYYVDRFGVPFFKNYFDDPKLSIIDKSGVVIERVKQVANDSFLSFVGQLVALAEERGLKISKIIIPPLTTRQLEVYIDGLAYPIKMTSAVPAAQQVDNLLQSKAYFKKHNLQPKYLDARVEGRVYFK